MAIGLLFFEFTHVDDILRRPYQVWRWTVSYRVRHIVVYNRQQSGCYIEWKLEIVYFEMIRHVCAYPIWCWAWSCNKSTRPFADWRSGWIRSSRSGANRRSPGRAPTGWPRNWTGGKKEPHHFQSTADIIVRRQTIDARVYSKCRLIKLIVGLCSPLSQAAAESEK